MAKLPEFKAVAIRDAIVAALRRAMLEGRFAPGEAIVESAIAAEMKVSRGPVREALLLLTQEGLATHSQNRGFAVLDLTEAEKLAADQVRCQLEILALQLARERITPAELAELERIKERVCDHFRSSDSIERLDDEIEFYGIIWRVSENPYLPICLQRVAVHRFQRVIMAHPDRPDLTPEIFDSQHQLYLDYLGRRTEKTAGECVRFALGFREPGHDLPPSPL